MSEARSRRTAVLCALALLALGAGLRWGGGLFADAGSWMPDDGAAAPSARAEVSGSLIPAGMGSPVGAVITPRSSRPSGGAQATVSPLESVPAEQLDRAAIDDPAAHRAARRARYAARAEADALALHAASGAAPLDPALLAEARAAALLASP